MSDKIREDGGPAFPRPCTDEDDGSAGMSLRDFFAAGVMFGLTALPTDEGDSWAEMARRSYIAADAMLAAREAKP